MRGENTTALEARRIRIWLGILAAGLFILIGSLIGAITQQPPVQPVIVEVIGYHADTLNERPLLSICRGLKIPLQSVYSWKNHLVVYGIIDSVQSLQKQIEGTYAGCITKIYDDPFYDFNRKMNCGDDHVAKQWDNIILTANLVNDKKLQAEYLAYHANQFARWPEVSDGFCNAGFQQLLVYKSGRQLMLVISIPKGESLDRLNPKTTENNPRAVQWNTLMKKYQEGIAGARPGEAWVFFKPVGAKL